MQRLSPTQRSRARALRSEPTDAERRLWSHLRGNQVSGARFRRQHPLGRYVADFACITARLVVEVDGGQHADNAHDAERDAWMRAEGWRVLRFWNHEVLGNIDGVVQVIADALASPPPQPSPWQGEGVEVLAPSPGQGEGWGGGRT